MTGDRLRPLFAPDRPLHGQAHPWQSVDDRREDDRVAAASSRPTTWREVAPHDGTVIGIVSQGLAARSGARHVAAAQGQPARVQLDRQCDLLQPAAGHLAHLATKTIDDAKKRVTTIGTTGAGSASVQYPPLYNNVPERSSRSSSATAAAHEIDLAMERGEVEGRGTNPYSSYMATRPDLDPGKTRSSRLSRPASRRSRAAACAADP